MKLKIQSLANNHFTLEYNKRKKINIECIDKEHTIEITVNKDTYIYNKRKDVNTINVPLFYTINYDKTYNVIITYGNEHIMGMRHNKKYNYIDIDIFTPKLSKYLIGSDDLMDIIHTITFNNVQ